jgi:hypothetical protein
MGIVSDILAVLAEEPIGELPVHEVKDRVSRRIKSPEEIAKNMRAARDANSLTSFRKTPPALPENIFGTLISEPRSGIWKITDEGRAYLRSLV